MSLTFNMVGGGGGGLKNTDAVLIATVPTGSTVTATKSGTTLTPNIWTKAADSTLDCAIFSISASQFDGTTPWTVTASLGSNTASTTVLIVTNDEYDVALSYYLYAWKYGGSYDQTYWGTMNVTHPAYTTIGDTIVGVSPSSGYQWTVVWPNAFSASRKLSKIYLDVKIDSVLVSSGGYELKFGVSNVNSGLSAYTSYCVAYKMVNTVANRQTYELDVSSVESGYLFVGGVGGMTIYNMYGE